jgi:hypothetical protein
MKALLCLALVLIVPLAANADWRLDRFMISAWGGPTDEASAKAFADAGFNTVMAKVEKLDLLRPYGIRAIVFDGSPELAAKMKDDPVIWGWYVRDEPGEDAFAATGEAVAPYHAADPNHPAYVNLMAWMNLDKYYELVKPRFLSYDYYQWWWGPAHYCGRLEAHRNAALKHNQDLVCWVESNADPRWEWGKEGATYLPDNPQKLRQSVYLAMAYGVRGIQWFTSGLAFKPGEASERTLNPSGEDIKQLNFEMQALGPTLLQLKSLDVVHTEQVPIMGRPVPGNLWVQPRNRNLTLGLFEGPRKQRYAMVVNRAMDRVQPVNLAFPGGLSRLERFDVTTKAWRPVELRDGARGAVATRFTLNPGDGALLRAE